MKKRLSIFVLLLVVVVGSVFLLTSCGGNTTSKPKAGEANVVVSGDTAYSVKYYTDGGFIRISGKNAEAMEIAGYNGPVKEINLAKIEDKVKIEGKKINIVSVDGFNDCDTLETVDLTKKNVTDYFSIESSAFARCKNLTTVSLPTNLFASKGYTIGSSAFDGCEKLTTVNGLDKFSIIRSNAFANCKALKDITLSPEMEVIPSSLFYNSYNLQTVNMGTKIKKINNDAFNNTKVVGIDFSKMTELKEIGSKAFYGASLTKVVLPDSIKRVENGAFVNNPLVSVDIPYVYYYVNAPSYDYNSLFGFNSEFLKGVNLKDKTPEDIEAFYPVVDVKIRKAYKINSSLFANSYYAYRSKINTLNITFIESGDYDWNENGIIDTNERIEMTDEMKVVNPSVYAGQKLTKLIVNGQEQTLPTV